MESSVYSPSDTAILLIDPYNDFLSEGGKLHGLAKLVADVAGTVQHMREVVAAARTSKIAIFYVPHHRSQPSDFEGWNNVSPYQLGSRRAQVFAVGSWGGEWHRDFIPQPEDVVVKEHWASSGFANTDLEMILRQRGIDKLILIGMLANTCVETTGKFGAELGFSVTLVKDATAAFSSDAMNVAHVINGPTYAHAIVTTAELLHTLAIN